MSRLVKGVVLDRDGTLIDFHRDAELGVVVSAFHPSQVRILPGVVEGLQALRDAGFVLAIATNQPGPAKGQAPEAAIERSHAALLKQLADRGITIAAVASCYHHPEGGPGGDPALARACDCRKPKPGLPLRLIAELGLDPRESWMIGDSHVDVEAAHGAGLRAGLLLDTKRCELCPNKDAAPCDRGAELVAARFDAIVRGLLTAPSVHR